ncbi:MAG: UvrD-helicase domain-containing protein [Candidatus Omnitrophota bacterium]
MRFVEEFKRNPHSSGVNYEKIRGARDNKLHSVRIDQAYRGIVVKPEQGNVYVLLWVDQHDAAYAWAEKRICKINPETGSLQIFSVDDKNMAVQKEERKTESKGLFDDIRTKYLLKLGVPEELIELVRSIKNDNDLELIENKFPQEAFEALYMLAAGFNVDEVFIELNKKEEKKTVDITDYEAALAEPDSQRQFYVVENELELEAILNAPLEKWRVFLHPSQRRLISCDWNGPVRVLGGAGTGKTVVAMHRAKWLAEHRAIGKYDRVLFTTFTRNLAEDIKSNLQKICLPEVLDKIEVVNLDQWVSNSLKKHGYRYRIDYGKETQKLWENALTLQPANSGLSEEFYREEWEKVIQAYGIKTLEEYLKVSRIGRGTKLNRNMRKEIWLKVFEEYRTQLNENSFKEREDAIRDCCEILKQKKDSKSYIGVIVDEGQDMGNEAFKLIRQIIPENKENDIFIVGDGHQKIYRYKVVLGQCGINIRGRARKLRINYRTTDEIKRWAVQVLKGVKIDDLDGQEDNQNGYRSLLHGEAPVIKSFKSFEEEIAFIASFFQKKVEESSEVTKASCIVVRTNKLLEQYMTALEGAGVKVYKIRRSEAENRQKEGVRIATMHRVKGLEFDNVVIAGANKDIVPLNISAYQTSDLVVRREYEQIERSLLYVSATRAKKQLVITSYGKMSELVR